MKKWSKLLIAVLLVVCVISPIFTTASCEINPIYDPSDVDNTYLAEDINDNWLLKLLAGFVYTVAGWAESVIGNLLGVITGRIDFPWADKIVFNAVPVLDVNFISPASGSYMALASKFIQKIYWTMFTIALSLFGVLVLITAIKLAISTIASDKAKYKQALTSWVLGFVMLWTIHFLMAFLFYLNEQLVIEASQIASNSFDAANEQMTQVTKQRLETAIDNVQFPFTNYLTKGKIDETRFNHLYSKYIDAYEYLYFTVTNNGTENIGLHKFLSKGYATNDVGIEKNVIERLTSILDCLEDKNEQDMQAYVDDINECLDVAFFIQAEGPIDNALFTAQYESFIKRPSADFVLNIIDILDNDSGNRFFFNVGSMGWGPTVKGVDISIDERLSKMNKKYIESDNFYVIFLIGTDSDKDVDKLVMVDKRTGKPSRVIEDFSEQVLYFDDTVSKLGNVYYAVASSDYEKGVKEVVPSCVLADLREIIEIVKDEKSDVPAKVSYVTNLALYFKSHSHETRVSSDASVVKTDAIVSNQIMYAILVVQSIMLFIAYMKRLFFVLLLSMLAPFVVVLDFFQKFGK